MYVVAVTSTNNYICPIAAMMIQFFPEILTKKENMYTPLGERASCFNTALDRKVLSTTSRNLSAIEVTNTSLLGFLYLPT